MDAILKGFIDQGLHLPPNVQDYAAGLVAGAYQAAIETLAEGRATARTRWNSSTDNPDARGLEQQALNTPVNLNNMMVHDLRG